MRMCTRFFYLYELHFYNQYQAEMGKIISKRWAKPWSWTFTIWKLIHFLHPIINSRCHPKIIRAILKMYKKQVSLFQWRNMINVNEKNCRENYVDKVGKKVPPWEFLCSTLRLAMLDFHLKFEGCKGIMERHKWGGEQFLSDNNFYISYLNILQYLFY